MADFERDGYVIMRGVVDHHLIDSFWDEVAHLQKTEGELSYGLSGGVLKNRDVLDGTYTDDTSRLRIVGIENFSAVAPSLILHPSIADFLSAWYDNAPTCIQSLTYRYSSQQGAHSDKYLVSPRSVGHKYDRDSLAASWIACEDVDEGNGSLIIYPGSHKPEKKTLKEDFEGNYTAYVSYLENLCTNRGIETERFTAAKGDVLIWHGDFVHAGGRILQPERTRLSLVNHYANLTAEDPGAGLGRKKHKYPNGYIFKDEAGTSAQ
ncbi:hypothetical protein GCM10011342_17920 [Aquisalinus flavus]|uniref:Phytanoyl-CoA dioxygenase n=1 Tax=Aquisalinus flavus TaxID=1526572 RepID=A0A8J2Y7Y6_9PROT|nr:hypothetical protein GCM10011342_17920 [Aquisalinus flavus]